MSYAAPPRDCYDLLHMYNMATSGVYYVYPDISAEAFIPVEVWCDMETDEGGWTVSRTIIYFFSVRNLLHMYNMATSGVYYVYPDISAEAFIPVEVWCDMDTRGGG